jgi:septal ring factor EnvC (AmiA/AmiB activator)
MITIPIDLTMAVAIIGCILAIVAFFDQRRKAAMAEGRHMAEVKELEKRLGSTEGSVKMLQGCYQTTEADIREIKTDIIWIKRALTEIKDSLNQASDVGR